MARKRKKRANLPPQQSGFEASPFSPLKGFAVSATGPEDEQPPEGTPETTEPDDDQLFAREMAALGVDGLGAEHSAIVNRPEEQPPKNELPRSDEEEFLDAMRELQVEQKEEPGEDPVKTQARPGRLKRLKQGRLAPEATLDLHGLYRHQVGDRVRFFLEDGQFQGYQTLLIITGRGLHSEGEPVVRAEVERFLREDARSLVAEWARAPRQFGGEGALVVFLKEKPS